MNKGNEKEDLSSAWDTEETTLLPFLQAAEDSKNSNVTTIRSIVMKVLAEPSLFAGYNRIKAILEPSLQQQQQQHQGGGVGVGGGLGDKIARTLDLFSYGTMSDFTSNPSQYLELTSTQLGKLRQLSVLSVIQQAQNVGGVECSGTAVAMIPYHDFERALQLPSSDQPPQDSNNTATTTTSTGVVKQRAEVEDILISCLYMGVIHGKLCQKSRSLHLSARYPIRPRDVPPSQIAVLMERIRSIQASIQGATADLDQQKQQASQELQTAAAFWQQAEERRKKSEIALLHNNSSGAAAAAAAVLGSGGWDADVIGGGPFGVVDVGGLAGNNTRRQKRGRAAAAASSGGADPSAVFARFQA